jgi:hypothetical protein
MSNSLREAVISTLKTHTWREIFRCKSEKSFPVYGDIWVRYYCDKCGLHVKCLSFKYLTEVPENVDLDRKYWTLSCDEVIVEQIHGS